MPWIIDVELHLKSMSLIKIIKEKNTTSSQDKEKLTIFICRHLDGYLKCEYLTVKDSSVLWKNLKERYDHLSYQKKVVLSATHDEWNALYFKTSRKLVITSLQCSNSHSAEILWGEYHIWWNIR